MHYVITAAYSMTNLVKVLVLGTNSLEKAYETVKKHYPDAKQYWLSSKVDVNNVVTYHER